MKEEITLPNGISIFDAMNKLRKVQACLFDENIPRSEILKDVNKVINELEDIASTASKWESLFFKIANKIRF